MSPPPGLCGWKMVTRLEGVGIQKYNPGGWGEALEGKWGIKSA